MSDEIENKNIPETNENQNQEPQPETKPRKPRSKKPKDDGQKSDNNKNPETPEDSDPFNFFRLSVNPEDGMTSKKGKKRFPIFPLILAFIALMAFLNIFSLQNDPNLVDYSEFKKLVEDGKIVSVEIGESSFIGYGPVVPGTQENDTEVSDPTNPVSNSTKPSPFADKQIPNGKSLTDMILARRNQNMNSTRMTYKTNGVLMSNFIELLDAKGIQYKFVAKQNSNLIQLLINVILPFGLIFIAYFFIMRKMTGGMGGMGVLGGGNKSKAVEEGKVKTRFDDVAGVDEAKAELVEVVDFLKEPKKYTEIGGKIPKGVLLVGPPGTGKTLLARAVAGEAGVPFFRISGSDFVEMFVGVGASRVRDLFRAAREKAPCIIFIDELDAIGKSRVNNLGGNDEREQTLNQLLVEMDGFDNEKGLILLAATNRPDILDPALLRPGRFDRQVVVDKPDVKGREAILKIHSKNVKIDDTVDFDNLAHATAGFAGADLANIVNEAALLAVRNGRKKVCMKDFDEAIEKTVVGLEKKNRVMTDKERKSVAVHETGHALVAVFTKGTAPVHKISIIPRGMGALGYTMQRSEEEKFLYTQSDLNNEVDILLGGRAAEQICLGEVGTGASNDIQRATDILRKIITTYGMSEKFYNVTLGKAGQGYGGDGEPTLVREYSENTQNYVDTEIARMMSERYEHVKSILTNHKDLLDKISGVLLEKETMDGAEFHELVKAEHEPAEPEQAETKTSEESN